MIIPFWLYGGAQCLISHRTTGFHPIHPSLFDPLTLELSILILFDLIFLLKNKQTFDPLSIAYLFSNC